MEMTERFGIQLIQHKMGHYPLSFLILKIIFQTFVYKMTKQSNILVVQCSYCTTFIRVIDSKGTQGGLSHGICEKCFEKLMEDFEKCKELISKGKDKK